MILKVLHKWASQRGFFLCCSHVYLQYHCLPMSHLYFNMFLIHVWKYVMFSTCLLLLSFVCATHDGCGLQLCPEYHFVLFGCFSCYLVSVACAYLCSTSRISLPFAWELRQLFEYYCICRWVLLELDQHVKVPMYKEIHIVIV